MSITEGNEELQRLVELLLIGSDTVRRIADMRPFDRDDLYVIVSQAHDLAAQLKAICDRAVAASQRAN